MDHRIKAISFTPSADISRPPLWSLRGSRSGRSIGLGEKVSAEDGDLVLTVASAGAVIPSCSVALVPDEGAEERALASALFGWLP